MAKFIGAIARTFKIKKKLIILKEYLKFTTYFETSCGCSKHCRPNFKPIS